MYSLMYKHNVACPGGFVCYSELYPRILVYYWELQSSRTVIVKNQIIPL
jgi:hypothetical protein